jgi:alkanesulfonate monooxygenase SsuD/methylene tetrahydromethanopterin reductase-like flavin-dependent oxidoreductase (luciferase family)
MRFGLNLLSQHRSSKRQDVALHELIDQARAAERVGFDSVFVNEHHHFEDPDEYWLPPFLALSALATSTERVRLGTAIVIAPLHNPVRLAEEAAAIHGMSSGRFVLGLGAGFRRTEFDAIGIPFSRRGATLEEHVKVVRALLSGTHVDFNGANASFEDVSLPLMSLPPEPIPLWLAGTTDRAVVRAARLADAWLPADTAPIGALRPSLALYHDARENVSEDSPGGIVLMRETFVARRSQDAKAIAERNVLRRYRRYWDDGDVQLRSEFRDSRFSFDELAADRFIVGSPAECAEAILRHQTELDPTDMILRVPKVGMPQGLILETIELIGSEVLPRCRGATVLAEGYSR